MPPNKRIQKRIKESNQEYEEKIVEVNASNDQLFTLDRVGSKRKRQQVDQEIKPKIEGKFISAAEKAKIRKIKEKKVVNSSSDETVNSEFRDLWEEEATDSSDTKKKVAKAHKLKVAKEGQSYNPDTTSHQNILKEAVALQIKQISEQKRLENALPLSLKEEAKDQINSAIDYKEAHKLLLDQADEDENDDDNDASVEEMQPTKKRKMQEKKTKAQRNRERARKLEEEERKRAKQVKQLNQSIHDIKKIKKQLREEELQRELRKKEIERLKQETQAREAVALKEKEISAVPLSDELQGSLRLIKTKAVPLLEVSDSLLETGLVTKQNRRAKRQNEKPRGARKIKLVAKYKYNVQE